MSGIKKKRKSSRKLMENRARTRYHFRVMEHYEMLKAEQKKNAKLGINPEIKKS